MIKIAIVEDEDKWANIINEYLQRYTSQQRIDIAITRFSDGYDLVDGYSCDFDIIFMDIEMGLMNGMEAAESIVQYTIKSASILRNNLHNLLCIFI